MVGLHSTTALVAVLYILANVSGQTLDSVYEEAEPCTSLDCESRPPQWGEWSVWGPCHEVSGQETAYRMRECQTTMSGGAYRSCEGSSVEYKVCVHGSGQPSVLRMKASSANISPHLPLSADDEVSPITPEAVQLSRIARSVVDEVLLDDPIFLGGMVTGMFAVLFSVTIVSRVNQLVMQRKKRCGVKKAKKHLL